MITLDHLAAALFVATFVVAVMIWMYRKSPMVAAVVVAGILLRLIPGVVLFWLSYSDSSIGASLHSGDGFWDLAPDAKRYFLAAAEAAHKGIGSVSTSDASPAYIRALGFWMQLVGIHPISGLFLNVVLYVLSAAALVVACECAGSPRGVPSPLLPLVAVSFSPALVMHATQPLKDAFFVTVTVLSCTAALVLFASRAQPRAGKFATTAGAATALILGVYLLAGVRYYAGFLAVGSLAAGFAVAILLRPGRRTREALFASGFLGACWLALVLGAGPYYHGAMRQLIGSSSEANLVPQAQQGFRGTEGDTNFAGPGSPWGAGTGVVLLLVPSVVARELSLIDIRGGRGLLWAADLDTLYFDVTVLALLLMGYRTRARPTAPLSYQTFVACLAVVTAGLMVYVVSNLGALVRLRLMIEAPLWMMGVAFMRSHLPRDLNARRQPSDGAIRAEARS